MNMSRRKVISYALFGWGKQQNKDCFDFYSYLRGLAINIRLARLLYPDWDIILHLDESTYDGFGKLFNSYPIKLQLCSEAPLTKAMLWRMKPCFEDYDFVICRDLDSPLTYREAQAVDFWMKRGTKTAHAITDSISHNIPLMGGMIGFIPAYFRHRTGYSSWEQMVNVGYDWERKGADQDFLNNYIYPKVAQHGNDSITQHYILGMGNTFLSDYHNTILDVDIDNVPAIMRESNTVAGHIGAAGWYETYLFKFLKKYWDRFDDILEAEKEYKEIFYWA